jgi:hypothetical protein
MTLSNQTRINEIYKYFKADLTRCIKCFRRWRPEIVKEYFWTLERDKIDQQIQVICKPFSDIQKIQISKAISDLHTFFINNQLSEWQLKKSNKNSKTKSMN